LQALTVLSRWALGAGAAVARTLPEHSQIDLEQITQLTEAARAL
jgi:hypothetical protein